MHTSAMRNGADFFNSYCSNLSSGLVLDIGSQDVNGSLRQVCPSHLKYIGVDFVAGRNVDVILNDPYTLPFDDNQADVILSSSCFEHSEMFWIVFLEVMRVLKPTGVFYLSVPSNGAFHRYPVDCWRFYPDSGNALVAWAKRNGVNAKLLESFTSLQDQDIWNDFTAVILKDDAYCNQYPNRMSSHRSDVENVIICGSDNIAQFQTFPEDQRKLIEFHSKKNEPLLKLSSGHKAEYEESNSFRTSSETFSESDNCPVCGGAEFISGQALWPKLIDAWELSAEEVVYVNEQQATICKSCGSNVRSMTLALALRNYVGSNSTLLETVEDKSFNFGKILEVNEAGTLHNCLSRLPEHQFASYPEYDLTNLSIPSDTFDIVVHSDTLEHIPNPDMALQECWRVLKPGGALIFTVPVIVGRMSRSRAGLPKSFHGAPNDVRDDMVVHTEYGADIWVSVMQAGFSRCEFFSYKFPAGIALLARKSKNSTSDKRQFYEQPRQQPIIQKSISTDEALQEAVNEVLQLALEYEQAANLEQAEKLYREIVNYIPRHAEANYHLGVIESSLKGPFFALPRLEIAVEVNPANEQYWVTYIDALMLSGTTHSIQDVLKLGQQHGLKPETAATLKQKLAELLNQ